MGISVLLLSDKSGKVQADAEAYDSCKDAPEASCSESLNEGGYSDIHT